MRLCGPGQATIWQWCAWFSLEGLGGDWLTDPLLTSHYSVPLALFRSRQGEAIQVLSGRDHALGGTK